MTLRTSLAGAFVVALLAVPLAVPLAASATERIVSVGGAVTETLYALGVGDRIVAVDSTSSYPEAARTKPNVGYMRALAAEPIVAMKPTLVIAAGDSGPPAVLRQLRDAGVELLLLPEAPSVANVYRKIEAIADAVGRDGEGAALVARIQAELRAVEKALVRVEQRPRVLFLLSVGRGSPLAGGNSTSADTVIGLAGGINAAAGFTRYKAIPPEAIVAAQPDVILVTDRTLDRLGGVDKIAAGPGIAPTPAGRAKRVVAVDGLLLLGFGPRTGTAARLLAAGLHPGIGLRPPPEPAK